MEENTKVVSNQPDRGPKAIMDSEMEKILLLPETRQSTMDREPVQEIREIGRWIAETY